MSLFKVGKAVRWTSSNKSKEGVIAGVVPSGKMPKDVGFSMVGVGALPRHHESYVIRVGGSGKGQFYWPVVSLLNPVDGLTQDEMDWCNKNVDRIRALMQTN
jgi:hypothetical protein